ncbi:MAG: mechanosensitive ion channel family protein [Rubricella sp.]
MDEQIAALLTELEGIWASLSLQFSNLLLPSRLWQIAILALVLVLAWLLRRWAEPRLDEWLRARAGWPKWRLRAFLVLKQRLQIIFFVILAWLSVGIMAEVSPFVSRRFILELVATIATALLAVRFITRIVRNVLLRRIVTWGLWTWIILHYLGLADGVARLLDSAAIEAGEVRISVLAILQGLAILGIFIALARFIVRVASARIRADGDISPSMQELTVKIMQVALYGAAFFIGLQAVGVDLTGLAFLSGAIGLGLGFGLQKVVSNLVSGVIILLDKSIKPGDVISLGDTFGWINSLGARYVSVVTRDGKEYLIPNEDLITGQVVNWSHSNEFVRLDIYFGTAYSDDPHTVRRIAIEAAQSVPRVLTDRPPVCHITGFGDSSVDYILRFWITDPTGGLTNIRGNVYLALWDAFKEHGISIPFPQREVRILKDDSQPSGGSTSE